MTAVLYDEVVTTVPALPAPRLTLAPAPAPTKISRKSNAQQVQAGGDPLVDGAARLLSVPLRHLYAALWRAGVLEVGA
ncbi:MAG TPA: Rv1535 family protein [Mycobacterium sp.]|nr:Rv1535 family protein [Mycobacterium sp.]